MNNLENKFNLINLVPEKNKYRFIIPYEMTLGELLISNQDLEKIINTETIIVDVFNLFTIDFTGPYIVANKSEGKGEDEDDDDDEYEESFIDQLTTHITLINQNLKKNISWNFKNNYL